MNTEVRSAACVHRIFNVRIGSDTPLPGLPLSTEAGVDFFVQVHEGLVADETGFEWIHEWKDAWQAVTLGCARRGNEYLLRFPGLCDFSIQFMQRTIAAFPAPGATPETLAHLLLDQVIPRVLGHEGRVILHASAVLLPGQLGVAFLGNTGRGKSTLATSLYQSGCGLLTDDCLQLDLRGDSVFGLAAYPSLRLWPDVVDRLFPQAAAFDAVAHYTSKQQLVLRDAQRIQQEPVELAALFVLGDPAAASGGERVELLPIEGANAAMAMIEAAFVLDVDSRSAVRQNFEQVAKIARAGIPMYLLNYPRRYEVLGEVRAQLIERVQA